MTIIPIKKTSFEDLRERLFPSSPVNNCKIPLIRTNTLLALIELTEIINGFIELIKVKFPQEALTNLAQQPLPEDNNLAEIKQKHQKLSILADEVYHLYLDLEHCQISQDQNWPTRYQLIFSASNC